ncbi:MAG: class I SAM-dependent methyltransferase [Anaerolineae bacterium]|nr:class I SAM-dependent methyltransferase [Anaerolineae bacterium]
MNTTASFEHLYYENPTLWAPGRYEGPDSARVQVVAQWLPADVKSVLDVGCGNGLLTGQLSKTHQTVGVDRSQAALQQMSEPRCQANAAALPFPDSSFDAVVCLEVLEHLPYPVFPSVLREINRVARNFVLITVPYCEDRLLTQVTCPLCKCRFHPYNHVRSFTKNDLETLFPSALPLKLVRAAGIAPVQLLLFARLRLAIGRLRGRGKSFPWYATCPQCGYHRESDSSAWPSQPSKKSAWLKRLWPKRHTFLWWIALYEKG